MGLIGSTSRRRLNFCTSSAKMVLDGPIDHCPLLIPETEKLVIDKDYFLKETLKKYIGSLQ
jgi:hypothetical protein